MRKLISILSFVLLYIAVVYGQAVNIPITVSDNAGFTSDLYFGLDLDATDGLDASLGELDLPGFPPSGYAAAWLYPNFTTMSYWDYRAPVPPNPAAFPFTGTISYTVRLQNDVTANPMTVSWNLPPEIAATSTITAGTQVVSFSGTGNIVFNYNPAPGPNNLQYLFIEVNYFNIGPAVAAPVFGIAPTSFNFGSVFVGSPANTTASISNTGDADLVVQQPVAVGDFSVTGPFPITIPEGGAPVGVTITFTPSTQGAQSADLAFVHNAAGSPFLFHVTGTGAGTAPIFSVTPTSLNFGNVTPLTRHQP